MQEEVMSMGDARGDITGGKWTLLSWTLAQASSTSS